MHHLSRLLAVPAVSDVVGAGALPLASAVLAADLIRPRHRIARHGRADDHDAVAEGGGDLGRDAARVLQADLGGAARLPVLRGDTGPVHLDRRRDDLRQRDLHCAARAPAGAGRAAPPMTAAPAVPSLITGPLRGMAIGAAAC